MWSIRVLHVQVTILQGYNTEILPSNGIEIGSTRISRKNMVGTAYECVIGWVLHPTGIPCSRLPMKWLNK